MKFSCLQCPLGVAGVDLDRVLAVELDDWRGNSRCWPAGPSHAHRYSSPEADHHLDSPAEDRE